MVPALVLPMVVMGVAVLGEREVPVPTHVVARGPFRNEVLAFGVLFAVRSTPVTVPSDLQRPMRIAWLAPAGPVKQGDPVVEFDPTEAEKQYADGRSDRATAESKRRKASAEGGQSGAALELDQALAEEDLRRAEDVAPSDEEIFSRNEIVESRVDRRLLSRRVEAMVAKRDPTRRLAEADLALAEIERRKAELRVVQAEKSLGALRVLAPHDGILVYPLRWRGEAASVGDTGWPGQTVAELPDLSLLEARVFVLEADAAGVAAGQKTVIEIEGRPGLQFEGRVSRVETLAKPRDRQSPVKYFETVVAFERDPRASLKPGQRVRATVLVDDLPDVVTVPRGALFEKEGRRIAYRLEGGRFREVEVAVGRRSLGHVIVEEGLAPGDVVALQDPERKAPETGGPAGAGAPAAGG